MKDRFFKLLGIIGLVGLLSFTFNGVFAAEDKEDKTPKENKKVENVQTEQKPQEVQAIEAIVNDVIGEVQNPGPDNENPGQGGVNSQENGNGLTEVNLCHATGSENNPWEFLTVDDDATKGGHANHEGDIIPITDVNNDGQLNVVDCEEYGNGNGEVCPLIGDDVVLVSPVDGATSVSTSLTLDWDALADAEQYNLIVATSADFSGAIVNEMGLTETEFTVNNLTPGTTYYWMVTAVSLDEENECAVNSETRTFTTAAATNGGIGGGVVVIPGTTTVVTDGIGGGNIETLPTEGIGGGTVEEGIGGGTLPESGPGSTAALFSILLSFVVTALMMTREKGNMLAN